MRPALLGLMMGAVGSLISGPASANPILNTLYYHYDFEVSNSGTPPDGGSPWMTAILQEIDDNSDRVADWVQFTLRKNRDNANKITGWYFNFAPHKSLASLQGVRLVPPEITVPLVSPLPNSPHAQTDALGTYGDGPDSPNQYSFDGFGNDRFDLLFDYPGNPPLFDRDEFDVWKVTYNEGGLTLADFQYLVSADHPYQSGVRVQAVGANGDGSAWVVPTGGPTTRDVPEASILALGGVGGLGLLLREWRRRRKEKKGKMSNFPDRQNRENVVQ